MRVRDLIEALQKHDLNAEVWIDLDCDLNTLERPRVEIKKLKTFLDENSVRIIHNAGDSINHESNGVILDASYSEDYVNLEDDI